MDSVWQEKVFDTAPVPMSSVPCSKPWEVMPGSSLSVSLQMVLKTDLLKFIDSIMSYHIMDMILTSFACFWGESDSILWFFLV